MKSAQGNQLGTGLQGLRTIGLGPLIGFKDHCQCITHYTCNHLTEETERPNDISPLVR